MNYTVNPDTACWEWLRAKDSRGYGRMGLPENTKRTALAHRWFYTQAGGAIPTGHHLHHTCGNTSCVNPEHMQPVDEIEHLRLHGHVKLTWELAREIRASGERGKDLAMRLGVAQSTISMIRSGQRWREAGVHA